MHGTLLYTQVLLVSVSSATTSHNILFGGHHYNDPVSTLAEGRLTFCTKEFPRNVECFAADHNNLLTVEQLLSYSASQATQEMSLAIDNDLEKV